MEKKSIVVGLDPGFGNIKIVSGDKRTVTSSHVYKSIRGNLGLSENDDTALVEWAGNAYHVGPYAAFKGIGLGASFGFDRLLDGGPDVRALIYRAMHSHFGACSRRKTLSVYCALPVESLTNGSNAATNAALRSWLVGEHDFLVDGESCKIFIDKASTAPQPVAALWDYGYDTGGKIITSAANESKGKILVCSIGMNTIEMVGFNGGRIVEAQTSGAKAGVRLLIEDVAKHTDEEFSIADTKMREGMVDDSIMSVAISGYWETVKRAVSKSWGDSWRGANRVIFVGGGAVILRDQLQSFFGSKLHMPKDPIGAIAAGMYKKALANGTA